MTSLGSAYTETASPEPFRPWNPRQLIGQKPPVEAAGGLGHPYPLAN